MSITVRPLTSDDAPAVQPLRLQALRVHPLAFASSPEDAPDVAGWAKRLANTQNGRSFGAFIDNELVGMVWVGREERAKRAHWAKIGAMYVAPQARGHGAGEQLLLTAIDYVRKQAGVIAVKLAVIKGNDAARRLYVRLGFEAYAHEEKFLQVDNKFYDMEWLALWLGDNNND